jgi:hypothetical protein
VGETAENGLNVWSEKGEEEMKREVGGKLDLRWKSGAVLALEAAALAASRAEAPCEKARQKTLGFILIAPTQLRWKDSQGTKLFGASGLPASPTRLIQTMLLTRWGAALRWLSGQSTASKIQRRSVAV